MKEAGLTVGGFYKHFNSRDDLVAEAVSSAFGGWKRRVEAAKSGGAPVSYEKLIDEYLNEAHRGPERHTVDCHIASRQRQADSKIESDFDF